MQKKLLISIFFLSIFLLNGCTVQQDNRSDISTIKTTDQNEEHNPTGTSCLNDKDCECTIKCPDCCGKVGQVWKCVNNKCKLGWEQEN